MIEDATFNVIGKHGITADDPIVKAYIDLCREDEKFSVGTSITYLNVTGEFAISTLGEPTVNFSIPGRFMIQEGMDRGVFMLLYYDKEQPLSNIHQDVLNEDMFSWDFRRIERDKIKENLKSVYYELDWLH